MREESHDCVGFCVFLQVAVSLESIYNAQLPSSYTAWIERTFGWVDLNFLRQLLPPPCFSSGYQVTLLLVALSPLALIALVTAAWVGRSILKDKRGDGAASVRQSVVAGLLGSAPAALLISFFCVAGVSQTIFQAFLCIAYDVDSASASYTQRSFLRADLSISCDGSEEHTQIKRLAVLFVAIWPVGLLAVYSVLLLLCGPQLRARKPDALTRATNFLHQEYTTQCYYWELVELLRRCSLVGYVLLIPTDQSYARLVIGLLVCVVYLIGLLAMKPFASASDGLLAATCASTLVLVFLSALLIRTYKYITHMSSPAAAERLFFFASTDTLAALLVALCLSIVFVLLLLIVYLMQQERRQRQALARWAAQTTDPPTFDWRPTRRYASFLSLESPCCKSATIPSHAPVAMHLSLAPRGWRHLALCSHHMNGPFVNAFQALQDGVRFRCAILVSPDHHDPSHSPLCSATASSRYCGTLPCTGTMCSEGCSVHPSFSILPH